MTETKLAELLTRDTTLNFAWGDYGLDDVAECEPEFAEVLAKEIIKALSGNDLLGAGYVGQSQEVSLRLSAAHLITEGSKEGFSAARLAKQSAILTDWLATGQLPDAEAGA